MGATARAPIRAPTEPELRPNSVTLAPRLAIAASALLGLGLVTFVAARSGIAGAIAFDSAREIAAWDTARPPASSQVVAWVEADLERAARLAPSDANVAELQGRVDLVRTDRPDFADRALAHFERAVMLRPSSPYTWASMAITRYREGDSGPAFEAALRRAIELGPAEAEVQATVVDLGLATWEGLAQTTRQAVEQAATSAMKRDPREVLQVAQRRGRLGVVCRHLADAPRRIEPEWLKTCSREATS